MSAKAELKLTRIYRDRQLRKSWWPDRLGKEWMLQYPGLFDFDDFRQATNQPEKHFYAWFVAIHLFQRDGSVSLVEKYPYPSNLVKFERYVGLIDTQIRSELQALCDRCQGVQLPDLMVIANDHKTVSFAEVKGADDKLHTGQPELLAGLVKLGFGVELIEVVLKDVRVLRDAWRPKV
jgi:hypothetical protein